jgi:Peptidase family C25/Propeptide_C25
MRMRRSVLAAVATVALLLALPWAAEAAAKKRPPSAKAQAAKAFKQLVKDTRKTPRKALSKRNRKALIATAKRARRQARRNPCKAVKTLRAYRRGLRRVKTRRVRGRRPTGTSPRGKLEADALKVNVALMQLPRSRRCGGGRRPKVSEVSAKVVKSTTKELRLKVSLPSPTFSSHQVGGRQFQQMFMEGAGETGDVGKPGLPTVTEHFGVPEGADVALKINGKTGYAIQGVDLYPHQQQPVDLSLPKGAPPIDTFMEPPFQLNGKAYSSNKPFPAKPAHAGELGALRNLDIGGVDFAGGQYRPRSDTLQVLTSIDVTVKFTGKNTRKFAPANDISNPWEVFFTRNYPSVVNNYKTIVGNLGAIRPANWCGEEMLVITSPTLETAANTFKAAKQAQGYSTSVRYVGTGPGQIGDTKEQIQAFIRNRLNGGCLIRPTYVVLLGNTAAVPTWLVPCSPGGDPAECNIASDLPYSLDGLASDLFVDVQLGRIPVTDPADADAVVNKILTYQNSMPAPAGDDFYRHATTTSYFQPQVICVLNEGESGTPNCNGDDPPVTGHWEINYANHTDTRGFTKTSEAVGNAMRFNGYDVDRLYTTDDEDVIPELYYDGTPIPSHLRRPTFPWNSNSTDFLNAYNEGRFLILHRDHGWPDGWADPTLHSGHVPLMTNGTKLPVVFGINCSSAAFDTPDHPSFVELQVRRIGGGAVAGFGDTRVSPSFPNNHMTRGFFDALFPNLQPEYGSDEPTRRLGDVLVRGKQFMATQEGLDWHGAGDTYVEHYLYHLLGDPSMQMWAAPPVQFDPKRIVTKYREIAPVGPGDPFFEIFLQLPIGGGDPPPFNTVVTLFDDGEAIGRGIVGKDGTATIRPNVRTDAHGLSVSLQQEGALPAIDSVDDTPPPVDTALTLDCPTFVDFGEAHTFTGRLAPGVTGAKVKLTYTRDGNLESFERTVTTDANGNFSDTVTFNPNQQDDWDLTATYAGNPGHKPSSSQVCEFVVNDPS